jgi:DHA2 family multidrug resistance protein-like MFS transporter
MMKSEPAVQAEGEGLDTRALRWASLSILLGTFMGTLGASIANVALPSIAADLQAQAAQAIWVVNAYQLAMVIAVLPLASLGEKLGYKRVLMAGLVVFTLASLFCACAPNLKALVAARMLQGLGGACVATIVPALLRTVFPAKQVGTGIGYLALTVATSAAIGPSVAAGILSVGSWRWLFGINLPIGLFAIALAGRILPRNAPLARRLDLSGALLNALTLTLFVVGASELGDRSGRTTAGIMLVLGCVSALVLVRHQRGRTTPLLPIDLLRIPVLRLSVGTSVSSYTAQTIAMLALPFLLIAEMGRSAAATGLLMTPWPLVIVVVAPLSGRLSDRFNSELVGAAGLALFSLGLVTLALLPMSPSDLDIIWRVSLCGIGFGLFQTPNNRLMLISAPHERSGAAGGLMTMSRMVGMTAGGAVATVMLDLYGTRGAGTSLGIAAAAAGMGLLVALLRMRQPDRDI